MRTVGVEEELLLVAPETGRPRSVARQVLRSEDARGGSHSLGGHLEKELQEQMVEIDSAPHEDLRLLAEDLHGWRAEAATVARRAGAWVLASGTSPMPVVAQLVHSDRYERIAQQFGIVAREQLSFGCHVHVAVSSDEEAVAVLDRVRVWLPVLLALSANSPFWHGADTDFASYRNQVMGRWPGAGPTDVYGSAAAYREAVDAMVATGVLLDAGMVYADARPSRHYPTLEIRVADVCADVRDAVLLAALSRALVETAAREWAAGLAPPAEPTRMLRLATWKAARYGVTGSLLGCTSLRPEPVADVVASLVSHVREALDDAGDTALVEEGVARVLRSGNGAVRQRAALARTGNLEDVVAALARITLGQDDT